MTETTSPLRIRLVTCGSESLASNMAQLLMASGVGVTITPLAASGLALDIGRDAVTVLLDDPRSSAVLDPWRFPELEKVRRYAEGGGLFIALDAGGLRHSDGDDFCWTFGGHIDEECDVRDLRTEDSDHFIVRLSECLHPELADQIGPAAKLTLSAPARLLPYEQALLALPGWAGMRRDDLIPGLPPHHWSRVCVGLLHRLGSGAAVYCTGCLPCEDSNAPGIVALISAAQAALQTGPDDLMFPRDIPSRPHAGKRLLVLTVTEAEESAFIEALKYMGWREDLSRGPEHGPAVEIAKYVDANRTLGIYHRRVAKGVNASFLAMQAIGLVQPSVLGMIGICAGLLSRPDGGEQELGDAVMATRYLDMTRGKIVDSPCPAHESSREPCDAGPRSTCECERHSIWCDDEEQVADDPYLLGCSDEGLRILQKGMEDFGACIECQTYLQGTRPSVTGLHEHRPTVWEGEVVALPYVLKSSKARDFVKRRFRNAIALEMEGGAVLRSAAESYVDTVVVKGISDWGNRQKHDGWHQVAASSASCVILHAFLHPSSDTPGRSPKLQDGPS